MPPSLRRINILNSEPIYCFAPSQSVELVRGGMETVLHLTSNDMKLAAYLKLGLSTKEIAELMKISPRGVEISRYRLRKKLQIPAEVSLFTFFSEFKAH